MNLKTHEHRGTWLLAVAVFAVCSVAAAVRSSGFLEADGVTHYLMARNAWGDPALFVNVWGRPLCTGLFALPALLGGVIAVRLVSLAAAIGCAIVAGKIAQGQGYRWPVLAVIFTLGQPLLFLHSFSELTELPFALVLGLGVLAYQREKFWAMAVCAAIAPLGRPEGFALLIPVAALLAFHRRWKTLLVLPVGLIVWSLAGHFLDESSGGRWWDWLPRHWPYGASVYERGNILAFVAVLPVIVGPLALPAVVIGMARCLGLWPRDHRGQVNWIIGGLPLLVLVGHSFLYWRGMFSSNGEPRYLLVVAPLWGVLAGRGWGWVFDRMNWRRVISWAALAVVLPGTVNYYWRILPVENSAEFLTCQRFADWYAGTPLRAGFPRLLSNHPGIWLYTRNSRAVQWSGEAMDHPGAGVMLVWDPIYSLFNSDVKMVMPLDRVARAGWVDDWRAEWEANLNNPPDKGRGFAWHIFRSPLDAAGKPVESVERKVDGVVMQEVPGDPRAN